MAISYPSLLSKKRDFQRQAMAHSSELFATAMRYSRNERDAEDLVQETLLRAFAAWERFEQGTNCRAWLFRILTNNFINECRRTTKERRWIGFNEPIMSAARRRAALDPEGVMLDQQLGDEVLSALAELPAETLGKVDERFADPEGHWVGTSGRARVVAYNTDALSEDDLPDSIWDFADPEWKGHKDLGDILIETGRDITLKIVGPRDEPVLGAEVLVGREKNQRSLALDAAGVKESRRLATELEGGLYELKRGPPGQVRVQVRAAGYCRFREYLDLPEEGPAVIRLKEGLEVAGVVKTAGGAPIELRDAVLPQRGSFQRDPDRVAFRVLIPANSFPAGQELEAVAAVIVPPLATVFRVAATAMGPGDPVGPFDELEARAAAAGTAGAAPRAGRLAGQAVWREWCCRHDARSLARFSHQVTSRDHADADRPGNRSGEDARRI